ncbi:MAG TPA: winged helix-turn-helix domain-containing protein, partial [Candidatus Paceibacterota bacterium]|nr:winged helix-turn-helix domain-containing protein [Candidatus Paceibacterota bacterium]
MKYENFVYNYVSKKLKNKIISLRKQGLSYREISKILKCSRGSVSYHCSKLENDDKITKQNSNNHIKKEIQNIDDTTQKKIFLLYHFNISFSEI